MNDSFEVKYQQEAARIAGDLAAGRIPIPNQQELAEIMAHSNVDALHIKHVHEVMSEAKPKGLSVLALQRY